MSIPCAGPVGLIVRGRGRLGGDGLRRRDPLDSASPGSAAVGRSGLTALEHGSPAFRSASQTDVANSNARPSSPCTPFPRPKSYYEIFSPIIIEMARGRTPTSQDQREAALAIRERFRERLEELDMGHEDLARATGINRRTIDKYFEGDSRSPSFFLVALLAKALDVDLSALAELVP